MKRSVTGVGSNNSESPAEIYMDENKYVDDIYLYGKKMQEFMAYTLKVLSIWSIIMIEK